MSHSNELPQKGDLIAGKYRVEEVLGRGGMGVVVAARHLALRQNVAVKFLLPIALDLPGASARFLREARAAAAIQSEHVARVLDVGTLETGSPYMVMEHLSGTDFARLLKLRGPLPVVEVVDFLLQAGEAIAEAHSLGIIHRDLKPANLFRTLRADGSTVVKVLDFGLSKMEEEEGVSEGSLTATGIVAGSPQYMSPEQFRGLKHSDARTDIWALGVILYELLTCRRPFEGATPMAICASVAADVPRPISTHRPDVSDRLDAVVLRCLEKDPERRIQNMAELARALAPFGSTMSAVSVERIARLSPGAIQPPDQESPHSTEPFAGASPLAVSGGSASSSLPRPSLPADLATHSRGGSSAAATSSFVSAHADVGAPLVRGVSHDSTTVQGTAWGASGPIVQRGSNRWMAAGAGAVVFALAGLGALIVWALGLDPSLVLGASPRSGASPTGAASPPTEGSSSVVAMLGSAAAAQGSSNGPVDVNAPVSAPPVDGSSVAAAAKTNTPIASSSKGMPAPQSSNKPKVVRNPLDRAD